MSEIGVISWNERLERYFAESGERAHCLSWIHKRCEEVYSYRRNFIDLPVIIGSGIIAFLNAGSSSMFEGQAQTSSIALGVGSLAVGVLNTLGSYFGWAKRAEGHRISSIQYGRLYRFLSIEMSLPRDERMNPSELLKYTKDNYDRLQETSPLIPRSVIAEFHRKFDSYTDISKPEEANGLEKIEVYLDSQQSLTIRVPPSSDGLLEGDSLRTPDVFSPRRPKHQKESKNVTAQQKRLSPIVEVVKNVPEQVVSSISVPTTDTPHLSHPSSLKADEPNSSIQRVSLS